MLGPSLSPSLSPSPTQAIMTASGGIKKMLQGSWWLTVTQFCIEGLMVEGGTEPLPLALPLALPLPLTPNPNPNPNLELREVQPHGILAEDALGGRRGVRAEPARTTDVRRVQRDRDCHARAAAG